MQWTTLEYKHETALLFLSSTDRGSILADSIPDIFALSDDVRYGSMNQNSMR